MSPSDEGRTIRTALIVTARRGVQVARRKPRRIAPACRRREPSSGRRGAVGSRAVRGERSITHARDHSDIAGDHHARRADDIAACLASAPFVAEALVVDSGSADDTVEIARVARRARDRASRGSASDRRSSYAVATRRTTGCCASTRTRRVSPELAARSRGCSRAREPPHCAYAWHAAIAFSDAGSPTAKAIPTGRSAPFRSSPRALERRRGPRARASPTAASDVSTATCCTRPAESLERYLAKQNRYTTLQAEAMHARGERFSAIRAGRLAARPLLPLLPAARRLSRRRRRLVHIAIGCFSSFLQVRQAARARRDARRP